MENTVRVYAYLDDISLIPSGSVVMTIQSSGYVSFGGTTALLKNPIGAASDASGYTYIDVAAGTGPFHIKIPSANFNKYFNTPDSGSLNVVDITGL